MTASGGVSFQLRIFFLLQMIESSTRTVSAFGRSAIAACTNTTTHAHYAHTHTPAALTHCQQLARYLRETQTKISNNADWYNSTHQLSNGRMLKCIQISFECKTETKTILVSSKSSCSCANFLLCIQNAHITARPIQTVMNGIIVCKQKPLAYRYCSVEPLRLCEEKSQYLLG